MAKNSEARQRDLAGVFRVAHKRADTELAGFSRAFKIRDQMLSGRIVSATVQRVKKKTTKSR